MPTALLSVFNKTDAFRDFAAKLRTLGYDLLASGGTKKFLDSHSIESRDIADIVGPPIFGHRVVTLSREVYAAILARWWDKEDAAELERLGLPNIGLVYVDMYPLADALKDLSIDVAGVIEKIDIGGPTLLRAAAKADCVVVSSESQFELATRIVAIEAVRANTKATNARFKLAGEAEQTVSRYAGLAAGFYTSRSDGTLDAYRQALIDKAA